MSASEGGRSGLVGTLSEHKPVESSKKTPGMGALFETALKANMARDHAKRDPGRYYAREGVDPLTGAFEIKPGVHPGMGGTFIPPARVGTVLDSLSRKPCFGRKLAYIHVPFCEIRCLYCGFFQNPYTPELSSVYTDTVIKELSLWSDRAAQNEGAINAVYMGGGTPTALRPSDLTRLLVAVKKYLPLADDCEITLEGRTSDLTEARLEAAQVGGINRFSLGVQSFTTSIRQSMGRKSSREDLAKYLTSAREAGFAALVVDLIYGFPGQSMEIWRDDLRFMDQMQLDGLDCYQLRLHPISPLARIIARGKMEPAADLPVLAQMFKTSVNYLEGQGYGRLSMEHWSRTPRERNIYNSFTKAGASMLAFGPGAGGNLNGYMTCNHRDFNKWREQVEKGNKPVLMLLAPVTLHNLHTAMTEYLEKGYLDLPRLDALCVEHNYEGLSAPGSLTAVLRPLLTQWSRAGLMTEKDGVYRLTLAGQYWFVQMNQLLIEYIDEKLSSRGK